MERKGGCGAGRNVGHISGRLILAFVYDIVYLQDHSDLGLCLSKGIDGIYKSMK